MLKKLIVALLITLALTTTAYAAEPPSTQIADNMSITITDITEQQSGNEFALPQFYPSDIQTKVENGTRLLIKTFEVAPDVSPTELVEDGLTRNGDKYELRDILRTVAPSSSEQKMVSQSASISADTDETTEILKLLPAAMQYSENGFTGQLNPDVGSLVVDTESMKSYAYTIKDSREFANLDRNDPYLIPKTVTKNGITLSLSDVQWHGSSENYVPSSYSATASYCSTAYGSKPESYLATITYSGVVERSIPGNHTYSLVYAEVPKPVVVLPESFDWKPVFSVIIGIVAIFAVVVLIIFIVRNASKIFSKRQRIAPQGNAYDFEDRKERRKPHALGLMKRSFDNDDE